MTLRRALCSLLALPLALTLMLPGSPSAQAAGPGDGIDWQPWSQASFDSARTQGKPLYL